MYLREKIQTCAAPEQELKRVREKFNGKNMTKGWI